MASLVLFQEGSHFISCLQLADENLRKKLKDETNLRWIIVALHDALYALLIEKLMRSDGFGIFNDKFEKEVSAFYATGFSSNSSEFHSLCEKSLNEKLAGIGKLLTRAALPSGAIIRTSHIENLDSPSKGVSRLKEMRDFFSHPRPMLLGNYEDFVFESIRDTIQVINEVRKKPGQTASRHDEAEASILMASIEHYSAKWLAQIN